MIKWDLILGTESFYQLHHTPKKLDKDRDETKRYQNLLEQHHIVISTSLRNLYENYYLENAIEEFDELDNLFNDLSWYIDSCKNESDVSYIEVPPVSASSINDVILQTATFLAINLHNPIVISDSSTQLKEIEVLIKQYSITDSDSPKQLRKDNNLVRSIPAMNRFDITQKNMNNRIMRNSIIFSKDMYPNEYPEFKKWLKEVFRGEKSIDIFDPYFHSDAGLKTFTQYYIDNIETNAKVRIFTSKKDEVEDKDNWEDFFKKIKQRKIKYFIYIVSTMSGFDFHERRIYFNTSKVSGK